MASEPVSAHEAVAHASVLRNLPSAAFYARRIGAALNPLFISRAILDADAGYPAMFHDLLNEVRQKDGTLQSVLGTRENALLGKGWAVVAYVDPGAKDAAEVDQEIAAFVAMALKGTRDLGRTIAHLMDAPYKGYSCAEITWKKLGERVVPAQLFPIMGRRFRFLQDETLIFSDEGEADEDIFAKYPHRFIKHQPRINGDGAAREGLGRCLVWLAAFRSWAWRDWLLFAELFGKPDKILELDKEKADEKDRAAWEEIAAALNAIRTTTAYKLITQWPSSSSANGATPQPLILKQAADEMALTALGQLGTTSEVKGGLGSEGGNQEKVRGDILATDAVALAETIVLQLIYWIVLFNFGPEAATRLPPFAFDLEEKGDIAKTADGLDKLVRLGLRVPVSYVHNETGIPVPLDHEACLEPPAAPAVAPAGPGDPPDEEAPAEKDAA